jgi:hypothetical protein
MVRWFHLKNFFGFATFTSKKVVNTFVASKTTFFVENDYHIFFLAKLCSTFLHPIKKTKQFLQLHDTTSEISSNLGTCFRFKNYKTYLVAIFLREF